MNFQYIFSQIWKVKILRNHLLPIVKYLFLRNSYVCPIIIFMFETDEAKINNEEGIEKGNNHIIIIWRKGKENGMPRVKEKGRGKKVKIWKV